MTIRFAERFPDLADSLRARYDAPGRTYHNWAHIQTLLAHYDRNLDRMHDPDAVEIALYYHDVVYVPGSKTNETESAVIMVQELDGRAAEAEVSAADLIIRATAAHAVPEGTPRNLAHDCALFLDMDLAILGAEPEAFDAFDANIRAEFSMIPDEIFLPRRRAAMQTFLDRERIYITDAFHNNHDEAARRNLTMLVNRLA